MNFCTILRRFVDSWRVGSFVIVRIDAEALQSLSHISWHGQRDGVGLAVMGYGDTHVLLREATVLSDLIELSQRGVEALQVFSLTYLVPKSSNTSVNAMFLVVWQNKLGKLAHW
jgi:hypothetical protein